MAAVPNGRRLRDAAGMRLGLATPFVCVALIGLGGVAGHGFAVRSESLELDKVAPPNFALLRTLEATSDLLLQPPRPPPAPYPIGRHRPLPRRFLKRLHEGNAEAGYLVTDACKALAEIGDFDSIAVIRRAIERNENTGYMCCADARPGCRNTLAKLKARFKTPGPRAPRDRVLKGMANGQGTWVHAFYDDRDRPTGRWVHYSDDGDVVDTVDFDANKLVVDCPSDGVPVVISDSDLRIQRCVVRGEICGPTLAWHPNGTLAFAGSYEDGRREGVWSFFEPSGRLLQLAHYRRNVMGWRRFPSGTPRRAPYGS